MPSRPYRCIVVDDDEIDRLTTIAFVKKYPVLSLTGSYSSAEEVLSDNFFQGADVAFLDVDMPGVSGLALRKELVQIPVAIFITAFPDYAVESFDLAALDFMVKPVRAERFAKTVTRIDDFFNTHNKAALLDHTLGADTIFIKDGHEQVKLSLHSVICLEALKDYTRIITTSGKHHILASLGNLLKEKAFSSFIRVHKSYAVQKHFIQSIRAGELVAHEQVIPVGRAYRAVLNEL